LRRAGVCQDTAPFSEFLWRIFSGGACSGAYRKAFSRRRQTSDKWPRVKPPVTFLAWCGPTDEINSGLDFLIRDVRLRTSFRAGPLMLSPCIILSSSSLDGVLSRESLSSCAPKRAALETPPPSTGERLQDVRAISRLET